MDTSRFKEIVTTFLDSNDRFDTDRGDLALQMGTEVITGKLRMNQGTLYVSEGNIETRAEDWIVSRLAMVPLLADRILSAVPENPTFVTPRGDFLDHVNASPTDVPVEVPDALITVDEFLNRRPGGTCSLLYLTSDAGEGKTTTINELARLHAARYKKKEIDWLLVPISLGGRPFLRFDDVVVAALVNQLRFQRLYFDAFLQLVRMGVLVPALDGFEEIFIETSEGDAITSLGTLIRQLKGEGAILIAARRAYFEFRRLQTQARLLDGLPDVDVAFGRVGLHRWDKPEFLKYAELNKIQNADAIYESIVGLLGVKHPLLTRPVLVRRLMEIVQLSSGKSLIDDLRQRADSYLAWLVERLIEREANEKWIDKHGDPPRPLLSPREHHELLSYIAEEMWISKTSALRAEMLDSLAELFCESKGYSPVVSRQVKERIKQHALIVSTGVSRTEFSFDHDDFREFFLGEQLAVHLELQSESDIRKLFRMDTLPMAALDSTMHRIRDDCHNTPSLIQLVLRVAMSESSSTYVRENAGALLVPLLCCPRTALITVAGLVFPPDSLKGRAISLVHFKDCYFRPTSLEHTVLESCAFVECDIEHLDLVNDTGSFKETSIANTRVHSLTVSRDDDMSDYYDPEEIALLLGRAGVLSDVKKPRIVETTPLQRDLDLRITEKALQTFHRSTLVHEGTFKLRLSIHAPHFVDALLPQLLQVGILLETRTSVGIKYRLGVPMSLIAQALAECKGSFDSFIRLAGNKSRR